ncbi:MAG: hypothetical protein ACREHD_04455 [Pirellulales bacterium]
MRKGFVMLAGALAAIVGLSLVSPEQTAFARHRCGGRHHHRRGGCCGAAYYQCGPAVNNCGYGGCGAGCATGYSGGSYGGAGYGGAGYGGAGYGSPAGAGMQGPTVAPNGGTNAPPPPAPAPGT